MEEFLDALTPALREEVRSLLDDDGRVRLTSIASSYIDDEGNWPTEPSTAEMLAREFLHLQGVAQPRYRGGGLASATIAGLAGAGLAVGGAKGAVVLSSNLMANYWQQALAYQTGIHPMFIRAAKRAFDRVSKDTPWEQLAIDLTGPQGPHALEIAFGDGLAKLMERELVGLFKRAAWRGARSAIHHTLGDIGPFALENDWVDSYVRNFSQQQSNLARRTVTQIVNDSLEEGVGLSTLAHRLERLWYLTPRHARAVENFRQGLRRKRFKRGQITRLADRYADRLFTNRLKALSETETLTAFNLGREARWIQAVQDGEMPQDTMKMWVTAQDELVCPICRPLDGEVAELGGVFTSSKTMLVPAAHPHCRCIIIPVQTTADLSTAKRLIFPAREISKHLPGQHDQKDHGNWVRRNIFRAKDFSPRRAKEIREEVLGKSHDETYDNIISFLKEWNGKNNIEVSFALTKNNDIIHVDLGGEGAVASKAEEISRNYESGATLFHNHPRGGFERSVSAPSPTDVLIALLTPIDQVIVNDLGVYTVSSKSRINIYDDDESRAQLGAISNKATTVVDAAYESATEVVGLRILREHPELDEKSEGYGPLNQRFNEEFGRLFWATLPSVIPDEFMATFEFTPWNEVTKHLGGPLGKDPHPSGTPQIVHAGYDQAISQLKRGAYDFPMSWLRNLVSGSGFRLRERNRIRLLANKILDEGFKKPIVLWVYEDGPFVRDGMHRLQAAHLLGLDRVPVTIKHVKGNRPKKDLRGRIAARRIRREGPQPRRDTPFRNVKQEEGFIRWFNERMARRGEEQAEAPPKRKRSLLPFGKMDSPVRYEADDALLQHE